MQASNGLRWVVESVVEDGHFRQTIQTHRFTLLPLCVFLDDLMVWSGRFQDGSGQRLEPGTPNSRDDRIDQQEICSQILIGAVADTPSYAFTMLR